jgi:phthalate 4,5-dioxygenase oxygenase subunit
VGHDGPDRRPHRDRLGASDLAIVEFRKQMVEAVRAFQAGGAAIGTGEARIPESVCAFQAIVPKSTDWRAFATRPVWDGAAPALEPSYSTSATTP